jgi:outer membrane receptor for ferric coprogen and ferric-rhodotorulic acid
MRHAPDASDTAIVWAGRRRRNETLSLNAANLTNARHYPRANGDNNVSPGTPRSVQLAVRTKFEAYRFGR